MHIIPTPYSLCLSLLWIHIVLLTVRVYSSNHRVLYTIWISITRRFQKSVGPSVCPFVTLKKVYSSFIIDSRKIICITGETVWQPLQENEAIFSKNIFFEYFRANFRKITCLHKNACFSFIINSRIIIRISYERVWHSLQENVAIFLKYYFSKILDRIFEKFRICTRKFLLLLHH